MFIYKLTHKITKQIYIGKHNGSNINYITSGVIPNNMIKKHGVNIFDREIIKSNIETIEELNYWEKFYIKHHECNKRRYNKGLNLTDGGDGGFTYDTSKKVYKYSKDGLYLGEYKSVIEAERSNKIAHITADGETLCGGLFLFLFQKKDKIEPYKRNLTNKKVYQFNLEGELIEEFESIKEASLKTKSNYTHIGACCNNLRNTCGGFKWSFTKLPSFKQNKRKQIYYEISILNDEILNSWSSKTECAKFLNVDKKTLYNWIKNKTIKNEKYYKQN